MTINPRVTGGRSVFVQAGLFLLPAEHESGGGLKVTRRVRDQCDEPAAGFLRVLLRRALQQLDKRAQVPSPSL